jgi:hypothetical protein
VWTFGDVEFSTASHSTVRSHLLPMPASFAAPPPCHAHTHTHRERESQRERERQRERKRERESARESEGGGGRRKGGRERVSLCASRSSSVVTTELLSVGVGGGRGLGLPDKTRFIRCQAGRGCGCSGVTSPSGSWRVPRQRCSTAPCLDLMRSPGSQHAMLVALHARRLGDEDDDHW